MIIKKAALIKVIEESNAEDFERRYNEEMQRVLKHSPRGTYSISPGHYSGVIEYEVTIQQPEDIIDEFNLQGVRLECSACPNFQLPEDKRVKKFLCKANGVRLCRPDSPACEWLYVETAKGEVITE